MFPLESLVRGEKREIGALELDIDDDDRQGGLNPGARGSQSAAHAMSTIPASGA